MKVGVIINGVKDSKEVFARFGFNNDLPSISCGCTLVESGRGRRDKNLRKVGAANKLYNFFVQFLGIGNGGTFGFVCER